MKFVYLHAIGVKHQDIYGIINIESITGVYSHEDGEYKSIINLNNNRQFRSIKYIQEILEILREVRHGG